MVTGTQTRRDAVERSKGTKIRVMEEREGKHEEYDLHKKERG